MNTINQRGFQSCFVNTEQQPKSKRHICFGVNKVKHLDGPENWHLYAVEEWTYNHPDAPEHANITVIVTNSKGNKDISDSECILLDAAQRNIR